MNITISNISWLEYAIGFMQDRSPIADQYARESEKFSLLFCAKADGAYAGFMCLVPDAQILRIAYLYTLPDYRRKGICTAFVRFVTERARIPVRINVVAGGEFHEAIVRVCRKTGFEQAESLQVFTCQRENFPSWKNFMEKRGNRLCGYLEHRGYDTVRFADAPEDLFVQLKESPRSDYANPLDPTPFLDIPERKLSREMSYAACRDGKLCAYTLVTRITPAKVIFEHISDSERERGTGCILLPFAKSMEAFEESGCQTVSYAMYGSNSHANAFRNKLLDVLNTSVTLSENYFYNAAAVR